MSGGSSSSSCSWLDHLIYVTLNLLGALAVLRGPVSKLASDETRFVESFVVWEEHADHLRLPTVAVCRLNNLESDGGGGVRNKFDIGDFFKLGYRTNASGLPSGDPVDAVTADMFRRTVGDNRAMGDCYALDLETVLAQKHRRENEGNFVLVFDGNAANNATGSKAGAATAAAEEYMVVVYEDEDDFAGPPNLIEEIRGVSHSLSGGTSTTLSISVQLTERMKNCDDDHERKSASVITACVDRYLDRLCPTCTRASVDSGSCSGASKFARVAEWDRLRVQSYRAFIAETGCRVPCLKAAFSAEVFIRVPSRPGLGMPGLEESGTAMGIQFDIYGKDIRKLTEVRAYDFEEFLGDLGGISGLFLGLSFWGMWGEVKGSLAWMSKKWMGMKV